MLIGLPTAERVFDYLDFEGAPLQHIIVLNHLKYVFFIIYSVCLSALENASSRETRFLTFSVIAPSCKEYLNMECNLKKTESGG